MTHCDPPAPQSRGTRKKATAAMWFKRFHAFMTVFWVAMIPPTIIWWKDSVSYLVFISLYTIIVDHVTAWQTSRLERQQEKKDG